MTLSKISLKYSVLIISIGGIISSSALSFASHNYNSKTVLFNTQESAGLPFRLKIPSINVDAFIEQVGIAPDGAMDVPKKPDEAAWFNLGPRPGEIGSSVIDGHSGYKDNKPAVFDRLYKLKKGDKIYIEDDGGLTTTFVVRKIESYSPSANALSVFGSSDGLAHLNLITCSGSWNELAQSHNERLVVFTDKE